jgi:Ca2+-binding RTX toxin-like protein
MTTVVHEIAFIDSSIADWETLLAGLNADIEVVILDTATDGVLQIAERLRNANGLSAIHIFSHGNSGELLLGDAVVNTGNLEQYSAALATIGNALTETGDILLYGCNVAQGETGEAFIGQLAAYTGADVAGSTNASGGQLGDWILEYRIGTLEASTYCNETFLGTLGMADVSSATKQQTWHSMGEIANQYAFAALRADGSVVTWGSSSDGGNSSAVASQISGSFDVVEIFSSSSAFAALRSDGSVVTWGNSSSGGNSSTVAALINGSTDVVQVFSTNLAFAALRDDGSVVTWGDSYQGGNSSAVASQINGSIDVVKIFSSKSAFAALRTDGSVVTWGDSSSGGNSSTVASEINGNIDVVQVFSSGTAFAALRTDGSVVTWGNSSYGGNSSTVASQINGNIDVLQVFSSDFAFAALRADGSVVTWGSSSYGGNSSAVASQINGDIDVVQVFSNGFAFAALRTDGSVVTWGESSNGGNSSTVASQINGSIDVVQVFSASSDYSGAFAALRADGSVVTWGDSLAGGSSSSVASQINGSIDVVRVFSTDSAFAALRADGSVVTWGWGLEANSSAVASKINGEIDVVHVFSTPDSFAALRADGSVVTWGGSYGGDSSAVAASLDGTIDVVWMADPFSSPDFGANPIPLNDTVREGTDTTMALAVGATANGVIEAEPISGDGVTSDGAGGYIDKDWYQVTLTAGHTYHFGATATISDTDTLDAVTISLKYASGAPIGSVVDGANPTFDYTPDSGGTYYLAIGAGGSGDWQTKTGGYQVFLTDTGDGGALVETGAFFAILAYGDGNLQIGTLASGTQYETFDRLDDEGFDDDYEGFMATNIQLGKQWTLLSSDSGSDSWKTILNQALDTWDADVNNHHIYSGYSVGGLYHAYIATPSSELISDQNTAGNDYEKWVEHANEEADVAPTDWGNSNAVVVQSGDTVVLAFRGTDAFDIAFWSGQAWTGNGLYLHYEAFRPLIEAVYSYAAAEENGVKHIVVSGHSLGGAMADLFAVVDGKRFDALPNSDLTVVSLASPGLDPDVISDDAADFGFLDVYDHSVVTLTVDPDDPGIELHAPTYYHAYAHDRDRVYFAEEGEPYLQETWGLDGNFIINETIKYNENLYATSLTLPNIRNSDVTYKDVYGQDVFYLPFFSHGFGADHNGLIYWRNIEALTSSPLFSDYAGQHLIFGVGEYASDGPGTEGWFTQASADDKGERSLQGTNAPDFLIGLEGNDEVFGSSGDDLLDGGTGDDLLDGGAGNDIFVGGLGNDIYVIDRASELANITENPGQGSSDTLKIAYTNGLSFAQTISLNGTLGAIENATIAETVVFSTYGGSNLLDPLTGGGAIRVTTTGPFNLTGNGSDNTLTGNGATNALDGGAGNDTLYGLGGGDILTGGIGNDLLKGGAGGDFLSGGDGDDRFVFTSKLAGDADRITDFTDGDLLVLEGGVFAGLGTGGALAQGAFVQGTMATTSAQHLLYDAARGYLYYDADGSGAGAKVLVAALNDHPVLDAGDFWVA